MSDHKKYTSAAAGADNSVVYKCEDGNFVSWARGTRAWRNNNPGNIRDGDFTRRHGAIGVAGGFAIFPDYETGLAALIALLRTVPYQKLNVEQAINRYAPPVENNTGAYISFVEKQMGISRAMPMALLSDTMIRKLAKTIEAHEGYKVGTIRINK